MLKPTNFLCVLSFLLALVLPGCSSAPKKGTATPTDWSETSGGPQFQTLPGTPEHPIPLQPTAPGAAHPVATETPPLEGWITLDRWCQINALPAPQRIIGTVPPEFAVTLPGGTLQVRAGSRAVLWNGLEVQTGFPPREVEGRLLVNALDARKNFQPLLEKFFVPAPGHRIIVIDPGHGGGNGGTRSVNDGRNEKEFTLDWALRLQPLLTTNGWRVLLTRTNDVEVPLGDRVTFAETNHADFFLSLHFNASTQGKDQAGVETYCLTPRGMPSNLTREYDDNPAVSFPNNNHDVVNFQYALRLHQALLAVGGLKDRGLRRARFLGVLRGQNRPAVLVEGGYLSNPAEAERIATPAFRQRLAEAVAAALQ